MAIDNFIPEIWSASLLLKIRDSLVYAQPGVINRDYEGDVSRAGDTVHLTGVVDPSVRTYTKNQDITWDLLDTDTDTITITRSDYFAFKVDDIDKRQALPGFVAEATTGASYNLAEKADTYVVTKMAAGVLPANAMGAVTLTNPADAYNLLVNLRTRLTRSKCPKTGRFAIVPPEVYALLLKDDRFIRLDVPDGVNAMQNGIVGKAAGFMISESNTVPESGTGPTLAFTVIAGHSVATTYVEQIAETEAMRLQNTFGDGVRGLHLYDAKVVRPYALASAVVHVA